VDKTHIYIEFLQYSLNTHICLPQSAKSIDWKQMLIWAERQAVVGVIYGGIQKAGKAIGMPFDDLMEWIGYANQIEHQNRILNHQCIEIATLLENEGFTYCILKGQGNAMMYPNPLLRMSGDIDVWVDGKNKEAIICFAKHHLTDVKVAYHHVGGVMDNGVRVELHFFPGFTFNPLYSYRQRKFSEESKEKQFAHKIKLIKTENEIFTPTFDFNVIYQLSHIFKHFISGGIGLRQMIDYYYLLKTTDNTGSEFWSPVSGIETSAERTLKSLGLWKFAGAVMYVMKEVLGLEEKYLIFPNNEKQGKLLLKAILEDGNFGQHAEFMQERANNSSHLARYFILTKHSLKRFPAYPIETIFEIMYRFVAYFR